MLTLVPDNFIKYKLMNPPIYPAVAFNHAGLPGITPGDRVGSPSINRA